MNKKGYTVGIDDFKEIIDNNLYYVDKTNVISNLFSNNDKITYLDLNAITDIDMVMNFLFSSGYVTLSDGSSLKDDMLSAVIPNNEVKNIFVMMLNRFILENENISNTITLEFRDAIVANNKPQVENILNKMLLSISFYDTKESFYHGYMLGLFTYFLNKNKYIIKSNREVGDGRFDLMIESEDRQNGYIIEFKITKDEDIESVATKAIEHMKTKEYYKELQLDKVKNIYEFAIVFKGKSAIVR